MVIREDWRIGIALTGFVMVAILIYNLTPKRCCSHLPQLNERVTPDLFGFLEERLTRVLKDPSHKRWHQLYNGIGFTMSTVMCTVEP